MMRSGHLLKGLSQRVRRLQAEGTPLPPGFDPEQYRALNPDVAAACPTAQEAAQHYLRHGRAELRRVRPEGSGLNHPESRMLQNVSDRQGWLDWLRRESATTGLETIIRSHPRAGWLQGGFVLSAYLQMRPNMSALLDTPLQGAFHYLEFGIEENSSGTQPSPDPAHIRQLYAPLFDDMRARSSADATTMLRRLFAAGYDWRNITLTEYGFWEAHGLNGGFYTRWFDPDYYHAAATRAGTPPVTRNRLDCIRHFCATAPEARLRPHADLTVDAPFYVEHWLQTCLTLRNNLAAAPDQTQAALSVLAAELDCPFGDLTAFRAGKSSLPPDLARRIERHFFTRGTRIGAACNLAHWARQFFGRALPPRLIERLQAEAFHGGHIAPPLDQLTRALTEPMLNIGALHDLAPEEADALIDLADSLAVSGKTDDAEWLYRTVLEQFPQLERGLNHLADLMRRAGRPGAEFQLRVQSAALPGPKQGGGVWNLLALAEMAMERGFPAPAIQALTTARAALGGDEAQRSKFRNLSETLFHQVWSSIGDYADRTDMSTAQARLRATLALATPLRHGPIPTRTTPVRHVALVGNVDLYQCKLYRIDQKVEQLRMAGFQVSVFHPFEQLAEFRARLPEFDAAIFFRLPAFPEIMAAICECATQHVPSFYEIDDLVFDATAFPPPLDTYAGTITRRQHRDIACGVPLYAHAMRLCDFAIASTRSLAEAMAPLVRSGQAFEHHNALSDLHYTARATRDAMPPRKADQPLVLFYGSGTRAHKEDFHDLLEPALARILRRYKGRVELRLVGDFGAFRHLDPERDAIRFMAPVWDFEQYCLMVSAADINLSVLARSPVTDTKSEIKWLEAALFAIPSVLSRTATHEDVIAEGRTGFLCDNSADFERHITALIERPELRRQIGEAAREDVLDRYSLTAMGQNLRDIFTRATAPAQPRKPRLLVVNVFYPPQAIGGATRVVRDNIASLRARHGARFDILVVCSVEGAPAYSLQSWIEDGVPVWGIGTPDQGGTEMTARDPLMEPVFNQLLERLAPDLVHFHCIQRLTTAIIDATRKRAIPYLITLHDGWWISPHQFLLGPETDKPVLYDYAALDDPATPQRARSLWPSLAGARHLLAVSEPFAQLHRDCHLPNVLTCENGVPDLPAVTRTPHPEGRIRLGLFGGTERHKGLPLLRAALLGQDFGNLELLVIDHALKPGSTIRETWGTTPVIRCGKVPQSEVARLYAQIDILVAPSLWPESYGLVTREALATGAWVIASDRGAVGGDVTDGKNGHVVAVSEPGALTELLARIDAAPEAYRAPPDPAPDLRPADAQAEELAMHYSKLLALPEPDPTPAEPLAEEPVKDSAQG